jgi:ribosomal protein S28E/S33
MARRPRLRLVIDQDQPPAEPKFWQGDDAVFFHKSQISVGVKLVNFGRKAHGEIWEVIEIKTYRMAATGSGRVLSRKTDGVIKFTDDIIVRRAGANEVRQLSFATLSYSAIWRIAS